MNIPVDVISSFNTEGQIKPLYVRIEDEEHILHTYKIAGLEYTKEERFAGIRKQIFLCNIPINDCMGQIKLCYNFESSRWQLIG